jgi:hypothetical protein
MPKGMSGPGNVSTAPDVPMIGFTSDAGAEPGLAWAVAGAAAAKAIAAHDTIPRSFAVICVFLPVALS